MRVEDRISVMVMTHIVDATTNPYLENTMLFDTISSSHDKLGLGDAKYYLYIDRVMEFKYPELFKQYYDNIQSRLTKEFNHINVDIVEDRQELMRGNWWHMIDNCKTPYFLFLEHDWEFVENVPVMDIMDAMDKHKHLNYIRFPYKHMGPGGESHWDSHLGGYFEVETEITELPLTRGLFYSGNPHITKVSKCRTLYKPTHQHHWSVTTKGTSHLEKEIAEIVLFDIGIMGHEETHKKWGCFVYGKWGDVNHKPVCRHLGDWCRKR